ncbi:hypothetical protein LXL04_016028 [Taraxacum kok-saghyz]
MTAAATSQPAATTPTLSAVYHGTKEDVDGPSEIFTLHTPPEIMDRNYCHRFSMVNNENPITKIESKDEKLQLYTNQEFIETKKNKKLSNPKKNWQLNKSVRIRLTAIIYAVRWCAFQAVALRWHNERADSSNIGNFREMLEAICAFNIELKELFRIAPKMHYIHHHLTILSWNVFWLVHVPDTTSQTLKNAIYFVLSRHNLDVKSIRGQGYDGASNMRGLCTIGAITETPPDTNVMFDQTINRGSSSLQSTNIHLVVVVESGSGDEQFGNRLQGEETGPMSSAPGGGDGGVYGGDNFRGWRLWWWHLLGEGTWSTEDTYDFISSIIKMIHDSRIIR